jgi:hypothetical protein
VPGFFESREPAGRLAELGLDGSGRRHCMIMKEDYPKTLGTNIRNIFATRWLHGIVPRPSKLTDVKSLCPLRPERL